MTIKEICSSFADGPRDPQAALIDLNRQVEKGKISSLQRSAAMFAGFDLLLHENGRLMSAAAAQSLEQFIELACLRGNVGIFYHKKLEQLQKLVTLSCISSGKFTPNMQPSSLGFNIGSKERPIWVFEQTKLYEDRAKQHRVGHASGVTVRVHKGVYYHQGHSKSHVETRIEHEHVDTGNLCVTDENLYFAGRSKSFKIPFKKVVNIQPCYDGVEIMRDGVNSHPEFFVTGDSWFTINLLTQVMH